MTDVKFFGGFSMVAVSLLSFDEVIQ